MCSSALKTPSSISSSAIATLKTSHTTRPGWLWVSREKKIRPRDRARIGVGDVDLDLRNDDERTGEGKRDLGRREYVPERNEIHLGRLDRLVDRHQMADCEI